MPSYYFLAILLFFFLLLLVVRAFTTVFHELGHAVAYLLLSKEKVTVYIGSYGDTKNTVCINAGRLKIIFKYNKIWNTGLCIVSNTVPFRARLVSLIGGSVFSFIIAVVACYVAFSYDLNGFLKLLFVFFAGSAVYDMFLNLMPSAKTIVLDDGKLISNDGQQIKTLLKFRKLEDELAKVTTLFEQEKNREAASIVDKLLDVPELIPHLLRIRIIICVRLKEYQKGLDLHQQLADSDALYHDDYHNLGLLYLHLEDYESSLSFINKSIELASDCNLYFNNRGFLLGLMEDYQSSLSDLDKAIAADHDFAFAYSNRGYTKLKLGLRKESLLDLERSKILDPENSYIYRNLGIYYSSEGNYVEAIHHYKKALDLDPETMWLNKLMTEADEKLRHQREAI